MKWFALSLTHVSKNVLYSGQTLIEVILAFTIVVAVITVVSTAVSTALKNVTLSKNQNAASHYAQEGLAQIKLLHDSNYQQFVQMNGIYCLGKNATTFTKAVPDCTNPNLGTFVRKIIIEKAPGCGSGVTKVTSQVAWADQACSSNSTYCHQAALVSCLSDASVLPAP